jgi:hypothetical protein
MTLAQWVDAIGCTRERVIWLPGRLRAFTAVSDIGLCSAARNRVAAAAAQGGPAPVGAREDLLQHHDPGAEKVAIEAENLCRHRTSFVDAACMLRNRSAETSRLEPLHLALSPSHCLMPVFGAVVFPQPLLMWAG